jgi:4-hydroxyphenylacetate 3-monooxygenase
MSGERGAGAATNRPMTGAEYLESLRDGREVWIYGERVKDVTTHPAFRNSARMIARLYDSLHDPARRDVLTRETDTGSRVRTHRFFVADRSVQEQVASRDAIAEWARMTYGWMGRTPDYKASLLCTLGPNADFYGKYKENARAWYRKSQETAIYLNHAIVHPPMDRDKPVEQRAESCIHVVRETDKGIIVSGAKVVATGSALTNGTFVAHRGAIPLSDPRYACVFIAPMNVKGVKLICRASYEQTAAVMGSPFDYPLSSRVDENDAVFVLDEALIPWENVFVNGDLVAANHFMEGSGFFSRFLFHGCTRLAVKLEFIAGLMMKAMQAHGTLGFRGQQARLGEVVSLRNLIWSLSEAMARTAVPWSGGTVLPDPVAASAYWVFAPILFPKVRAIIDESIASGLIYLNSSARDFDTPELRPYLDKYLRGSNGYDAEQRVKLMKLLWDASGTEFAGRHSLYEVNYAGSPEEIKVAALGLNQMMGITQKMTDLVDRCLSEYDRKGWTAPDLINPDDVNTHSKK